MSKVAKKKKRRRRSKVATLPDAPMAKLAERADGGSLPPTKKSTVAPELAHDDREINSRVIYQFTAILAAFVAVGLAVSEYIDRTFSDAERAAHTAPLPMATSMSSAPNGPRLQRVPRQGLEAFRKEQRQELESYGWTDRGEVRIPIDKAMKLTLERGLPARQSAPAPARSVSVPTDSAVHPARTKGAP